MAILYILNREIPIAATLKTMAPLHGKEGRGREGERDPLQVGLQSREVELCLEYNSKAGVQSLGQAARD